MAYQQRAVTEVRAVLEEYFARTKDPVAGKWISDTHLQFGDYAAARRYRPDAEPSFEARLALLEAPPGPPARPPGTLSTEGELMYTYMHRLAEHGDAAQMAALLEERPKVFGESGAVLFGLVLLGLDVEPPELVRRCAQLVATKAALHVDRVELWSSTMWPGSTPAGRARQEAFLARLVAAHPAAAELALAQALLASRAGRHDAALEMLERALAHPRSERCGRWSVLEVLVRAVVHAPGSAADRRARARGLPPARRATPQERWIDELWSQVLAGDRERALNTSVEAFAGTRQVVPGLLPLWFAAASRVDHAKWKHTVRSAWRALSVHARVPDL